MKWLIIVCWMSVEIIITGQQQMASPPPSPTPPPPPPLPSIQTTLRNGPQPCDGSTSNNCLSSLTQQNCAANEFLEIDSTQSCCPKCRGGLGFGVSGCNPKNIRRKCAPGLLCTNATCELDKRLCTYTYHMQYLKNLPTCEISGRFAAKQCFGDMVSGRCFCSDDNGNRIFGFDWKKNAFNMTCACSRQRAELEQQGRLDVTLHCAGNGNYEQLQCDGGICWCAQSRSGQLLPNTRAVPMSMWKALPCYDKSMGDSYLRQCESAAFAQKYRRVELAKRGTLDVSFNNVQCDYDGSYGKYKIENGIASCVWRDGKRIGSFQDSAKWLSLMNCYCARDLKIFEEAGLSLSLSCSGNGNYDSIQGLNGKIFCVDRNGYPLTDYFNTMHGLNCDDYSYDKIVEPPDDDDDYDDYDD